MIGDQLRLLACAGIVTLYLAAGSTAQTRDQVKQQAENQLRQMTPAEIERALQEHGISVEEATKRAQALGISLQDYLVRSSGTSQDRQSTTFVDPRLSWQGSRLAEVPTDSTKPLLDTMAPARRVVLPGFHGRQGVDSLIQPFGYNLFHYPASTFLPSVSVATPPSYVLGAGDEVVITVWGETQLYHKLQVDRDGNVYIPDVGPVTVQGLSVAQFRDRLQRRLSSVYSGLAGGGGKANTFLDVSLGKLKTIQVLVLGEVQKPGGYALSSMSTVLHALYLAGGPTADGTLRSIRVVRKGETVPGVDLYD
jgi:hypothetical protein